MRDHYFITTRCTFCAQCLADCPREAIGMDSCGAYIDQHLCVGCGACYDNCAREAIDRLSAPPDPNAMRRPLS